MATRDRLLDIVEGFKEKLSSNEYLTILLEIAKVGEPRPEVNTLSDTTQRAARLRDIPIPIMLMESDLHNICGGGQKNFPTDGEELEAKWVGGMSFLLDNNVEMLLIRTIIVGLGYEIGVPFDLDLMNNEGKELIETWIRTTYPYDRFNI
jgi:hypothetical protein